MPAVVRNPADQDRHSLGVRSRSPRATAARKSIVEQCSKLVDVHSEASATRVEAATLDCRASFENRHLINTELTFCDDVRNDYFTGTSSSSTAGVHIDTGKQQRGLNSALAVELCAGTAGLTAELRYLNFDAVAIDHKKNRHATKAPCVLLDLATPHGQQICLLAIRSGRCFYVHMGVPCGTASRARNRPVPQHLKRQGAPEPKPLRSEAEPWGLTGLHGADADKVAQANDIYRFCLQCITECTQLGIYWSVENPRSSFLWSIPEFRQLITQADAIQTRDSFSNVYCVDFQSCNHGGKRDKWTRLLTNLPEFMSLAGACEGGHEHLPWGVTLKGSSWKFATADEAAYPRQLCVRMALRVQSAAVRHGYLPTPAALSDDLVNDPTILRLRQRAAVQKQPRGRKLPPLVPEYKDVVVRQVTAEQASRLPAVGKHVVIPLTGIPVGARLLRRQPVATVAEGSPTPDIQVAIGIPWTPEEFIEKLSSVRHPNELMGGTSDAFKKAVFQVLTTGEEATEVRRRVFISTWTNARSRLATREETLHKAMPAETQRVLAGKNLLLLGAMLARYNYADKELVKDIIAGFSLTGMQRSAHVFSDRVKLPEITVPELMRTCRRNRAETIRSTGPSGNGDMDTDVWKQTEEEVKQGWLTGPCTESEISNLVGSLWTAARRFGILQSNRVRVIDDYSEPYVNAAYGGMDKLDLGGVDEVAAMLKEILLAVGEDRQVVIKLSAGELLRGVLHSSLTLKEASDLVGRTLDLKAAYRQLAVAKSAAWSSVVSVYEPQSRTAKLFLQRALPFGATASVYAFNRLARAMHFLGTIGLQLWWSQFFDDYPHLSTAVGSLSAMRASKDLMDLVGCRYADEPNKNRPFAKSFTPLGVEFKLEHTVDKNFDIQNKPGRAEGIEGRVSDIRQRQRMSAPEAAELGGRFQYAAAQLFGRVMTPALRQLRIRAHSHGAGHLISDRLDSALAALVFFVKHGKPRHIDLNDKRRPVMIASDGACEGDDFSVVTVGALMIDFEYGDKEFFGDAVNKDIIDSWTEGSPGQVIGQAELLPIIMARKVWANRIQGRKVLYCIDNDSARDALIKADSQSRHSARLIDEFFKDEASKPSWPWFMRVASASNPGDGPSRLCFKFMHQIGATRVFAKQPRVVEHEFEF